VKPERWRRIQLIFERAVELDSASRARYLDEACRDDPVLRDEVDALLRAEDAMDNADFLGRAVRDAAQELVRENIKAGERFDEYRLVRELGSGGMGAVWLAERADGEYSAHVAIKLVRGGFASAEVERRFRVERQILADLTHPNIARLVDGGTASDGMPYIVMEYVDGKPITDWAHDARLPLEQRLQLFRTVCDAAQHAHQSLIVHRDIKPSNILVAPDGVPKLVDFGIAKMLAPGPGAFQTVSMVRPMTPWYASPEQIAGERITVATDVYALGLLLFELITGRHPYGGDRATFLEVRRRILEEAPPLPSAAAEAFEGRPEGVQPKDIRGDLDAIVLRALRRQPEQRYASAAELGEDIRRFLDGEPVLARGSAWTYQISRFARRYAARVSLAAVALLLLVALAAFAALRLVSQRDDARTRADRVARAVAVLAGVAAPDAEPSEEQALDDADALLTAASTLLVDDRFRQAAAVAGTAVRRLETTVSLDNPVLARARSIRGRALALQGEIASAEPLLTQAFDVLRNDNGGNDEWLRDARDWLAGLLLATGRPAAADSIRATG
jgi:serine/threonine-protein kinase